MERLFKETEGKPIEKFVIDVRFNGGGNSFLNSGIQRPVMRNPEINKRGKLFIITGRNTFSAAQNFTTDFMRESEAIFVGEPTGSRPNFVGETNPVILPYTQMRMTVSDLYWQRSWPMDHRQWIPPDVPTEMSSAVLFAGRDAAMEAILAFGKGG
jgi:C-terminal processing protease CtpA/Prc